MSEVQRVKVDSLSKFGEGIAHIEGKELYIAQVLPGAEVEVTVGEPFAKGSARCPAKVVRVITESPLAASTCQCQYFGQCGGCQLMHMNYAQQLDLKRQNIRKSLQKVAAKLQPAQQEALNARLESLIAAPVGLEKTENFSRFKTIRYFGENVAGELTCGFYAPRSHDVVSLEHCSVEPDVFSAQIAHLCAVLSRCGLRAYKDENSSSQECLRAVQLRAGDNDQVLMSLIVAAPLADNVKQELSTWAAAEPGLTGLTLGLKTQPGNALFTSEHECLFGSATLERTLLDKTFVVGPHTFLQVNYEICEKLYRKAVEHCCKSASHDLALDLCCGVGTMTLALADHFKHVIGVEIVEDSITAAERNAQKNGVENAKFIASDLKEVLPSLLKSDQGAHLGAIIADPSRAGLGEANTRALAKIKTPLQLSLVYCSLTALERELPILLKAGYVLDTIQGFDMFPHTMHVETLVLLHKNDSKA